MATNKYFKCPYCDKKFTREALCRHLENKHMSELPEGFTPLRVTFHVVNRKDMSYRRPCRICKEPTEWDENKGRYNFLCGSRECYEKHVEKMRQDMGDKLGINRQTATPEGLEKMLANRKISGKYKFEDGHEVNYTGSYEKKALEFFDKIMHIKPEDLMVPGPVLKYELDNVNHIYIPDMYYIPYNLIIEVKDGGNRPNKNPQWKETRRKQIAKEKFIVENTDYNYIRLTNNDFSQVLAVFADLKMSSMEEDPYRVIHINETKNFEIISESNDKNDLDEIKKFNSELNKWDYGVLINGKVETDANKIDWNKYKTIPINLIEKYHVGVCWDFVNYEAWWLSQRHINYTAYFFVMSRNKSNTDIITHTFITININGKLYWFESAWSSHQGVHEIISFKDVIKILRNRYGMKYPYDVFKYNPMGLDKNLTNSQFFNKASQTKVDSMETSLESTNTLIENTPPASIAPMVDFRDNDVIVLQYLHKNAFSGEPKLAIADNPKFDTIFTTDDNDILIRMDKSYLSECKYSSYILRDSKDKINTILKEGEEYTDLYETVFGHKQYTHDQIIFESHIEEYKDYYVDLVEITESITNYILKGDDK